MSKTTKLLIGGAAALAIGATALTVARAEDDEAGESTEREQTVQMGDLPAPVQQAIQKQLHGAPAQRIEKRTEQGRTSYEVYAMVDGTPTEMVVGEDGRLLGSRAPGKDEDDDD